jgi:hypothetical protein
MRAARSIHYHGLRIIGGKVMGADQRGLMDGALGVQAGVSPASPERETGAGRHLRHAPLMKVLGLPAETNPDVLGNVLLRIAQDGPHKAVAVVRQSPLMGLLPHDGEATTLAAALVCIACMSRIETVMQSLRR